jgi:hypothetical protein
MRKCVVTACLALAVSGSIAGVEHSAHAEEPDVGDMVATAAPAGNALSITGMLDPLGDVDLYAICIASGAEFSVNVDAGGGDGQLFLFDATGLGAAANDDRAELQFEPQFPAGSGVLSSLAPGVYYLALSNFNVDPVSAGGAIFVDDEGDSGDPVIGAEGPGASGALSGWTDTAGEVDPITSYSMTLTGVGACPPPPIVLAPASVTVLATSSAGSVVTYDAGATDWQGGPIPVVCVPASGSTFIIGTTSVTCSGTDFLGQTTSTSFPVTVENNPPVLALPAPITVRATSVAGAGVTFTVTATDIEDGTAPVACAPASGSTFPVGTTTVNCSATDNAGGSASGSFTVSVLNMEPPPCPSGLRDLLRLVIRWLWLVITGQLPPNSIPCQ